MRYHAFTVTMLALLCWACSSHEQRPQAVRAPRIVALRPLGIVPLDHVHAVRDAVARAYRMHVIILPALPLPPDAFIDVKTPRYRADSLLLYLRPMGADTIVIGITASDISTTKRTSNGVIMEPRSRYEDFGVFGLGFIGGPSCVVSTRRLGGPERLRARLQSVAVHECGHALGLQHCPDARCAMRDAAESIRTVDQVGTSLCERCRRSIVR